MAKQGLIKLLGSVAIGAGILFSDGDGAGINRVYSQETMTQEQREITENNAMMSYVLGSFIHSGLVPVRNLRDAQTMHSLSHLNFNISRMNENLLINDAIRSLSRNQGDNSTIEEKPRTYLANRWNDRNNDDGIEWHELEGLDRSIFDRDEKFLAGMYIPGRIDKNGKSASVKIYSPAGTEIGNQDLRFTLNSNEWRFGRFLTDKMFDNFGPGRYVAGFYYDGKFWEARAFEVYQKGSKNINPSSRAVSCNYVSVNPNGPTTIVGENKREFRKNEGLMIGLHFNSAGIGEKDIRYKIYNPKGDIIKDISERFDQDYRFNIIKIDIAEVIDKHGPGTYLVEYHFNGRLYQKRELELKE